MNKIGNCIAPYVYINIYIYIYHYVYAIFCASPPKIQEGHYINIEKIVLYIYKWDECEVIPNSLPWSIYLRKTYFWTENKNLASFQLLMFDSMF